MATFHGTVATIIKGSSTGGEDAVLDGVSASDAVSTIPDRWMNRALFMVETQGVSGTYSVHVISSVLGATFVIAGATGIAADGVVLLGSSIPIVGVAIPSYAEWASGEDGSGFTSSVLMAGDYTSKWS